MRRNFPLVNLPLKTAVSYFDDNSIGVGDSMQPSDLLDHAIEHEFSQIVQKPSPKLDREIDCSVVMLSDKDRFLNFPLSTILSPKEASPEKEAELTKFEYRFDRPMQKYEMLQKLDQVVSPVFKSKLVMNDAILVADEFFTNAVFNAPGTSRDAPLADVQKVRPGRVFAGHDDLHVIIGCEDQYGSLDPRKLLKRIRECVKHGVADALNFGYGGAGIGTFMIFDACVGLYLGVDKGKRTVIAAALPIRGSYRQRVGTPKTLHYFRRF